MNVIYDRKTYQKYTERLVLEKKATNIPATIIHMKRYTIRIKATEESINESDIY